MDQANITQLELPLKNLVHLAENDYIEFYGMNDVSSGTPNFGGVSSSRIASRFGMYKLGA